MTRRASDPHCTVDLRHWSRFTEREFTPEECRRCDAHLKVCVECRAKLRALNQAIRACRRNGRVALPPAVRERARRRAEALVSAQESPRRRRRSIDD